MPKIKENVREIKKAVKGNTIAYITAALGLVAGLAWNDAIKSLIETFVPSGPSSLIAKFFYALILTFIVALVVTYLQDSLKKDDK